MIQKTNHKTDIETKIKMNCAFYENCILPKSDPLCDQFPGFTICPEYLARKKRLTIRK